MTQPVVSVIVPIYKVRDYIARCAESLLGQTLQNIEYIFVNDGTPDDSMDVLISTINKFPDRKKQIKILNHSENKGLPAARNTGLSEATGEYIYHCDSDDYVEKEMLEIMVLSARKSGADFLWCDWFLTFESGERRMFEPSASFSEEAISNIMAGIMKYNVWNKLVKHELYLMHNIRFPEGYAMGEDMTMIKLLSIAQVVQCVPEPFYHYVKTNTYAYTNVNSPLNIQQVVYNANNIVSFLKNKDRRVNNKEIAMFLLNVKLPLLLSNRKEDYLRWRELYPDANRYVWANKKISFRTKILETMAIVHQFWFLRLYYKLLQLIYKFMYRA